MADQEPLSEIEESEDLFGFAELYRVPESNEQSDSDQPAPAFDATDCLFNFDEIGVEAQAEEELLDAASILSSVPELPEQAPVAPAPRQATAAAHPEVAGVQAPLPAAAVQPAPGGASSARTSLRSPLLWILLVSISLNLGVVGFTWRVSGKVSDQLDQVTRTMLQATEELQTPAQVDTIETGIEVETSPLVISDPEHEFTFERVRKEIDKGDYASARKRLYALLAIADRFTPDVREHIESTAQFVLADISMKVALDSEGGAQ